MLEHYYSVRYNGDCSVLKLVVKLYLDQYPAKYGRYYF